MPKSKPRTRSVVEDDEPAVVVYGTPRSKPSPEIPETLPKRKHIPHINGDSAPTNIPPEPSLGERLRKDLGAAEEIRDPGPPKADNLSILLEQGLKSSDNSLLQSVLSRNDEALIRKTIDLLPLQYTVPLMQVLGKMCAEECPRPNKAPLTWLSNVLTIRSSYLTTLPNLSESLSSVYVHSDRRIRHTDRFVRLAGTISASINLVKQRLYQKAAANAHKSEILSYDEPMDETESEDDDTGNTDEDMPSDEETDDDSNDEDNRSKRKKLSKKFSSSSEEESEPETNHKMQNGAHESDDDD